MNKEYKNGAKAGAYILLTGMGIILMLPFLYMISISLASPATNNKMLFTLLPTEFHWQNYRRVFTNPKILRWFLNSVILSAACIVCQIFVSSFVAFGFARIKYRYKNAIFMLLLATMMIPSQITMIPQFVIFTKLGLTNTLWPLIIPNFFGGAYNIFLLRQFITAIPTSLDEAAKIDGMGYFGIYRKIILPLIRPALFAVGIFTFNCNWGAFMEPLIYINDMDRAPLALGVQILSATKSVGATPEWNIVMVSSMLLTLPMIIVFLIKQKSVFEMNIVAGSDTLK